MAEKKQESKLMRGISALVTILLIFAVLLCVYIVFQLLSDGYASIGGYMMFRVVTGSMEPTLSVGTLLVTKQVDITSIQLDDIVCFRSYDSRIYGSVVTHRVVNIFQDAAGVLLETKGDANLVADGYYVSGDNLIGKVVWYTGENNMLSSVFSLFTNKVGFLGCIVFPCLLVAGLVLQNCVKNIRSEMERAEEEAKAANRAAADPAAAMSDQEYAEMMDRIRAELTKELLQQTQTLKGEQDVGILQEERPDTTE